MPGNIKIPFFSNVTRNVCTYENHLPEGAAEKYKHLLVIANIVINSGANLVGLSIQPEEMDSAIAATKEARSLNEAVEKYHQNANRKYFQENKVDELIEALEVALRRQGLNKEKFHEIWSKYKSANLGRWLANLVRETSSNETLLLCSNVENAHSDAERMRLVLRYMRAEVIREKGLGFCQFLWENRDNLNFFPREVLPNPADEPQPPRATVANSL